VQKYEKENIKKMVKMNPNQFFTFQLIDP